MLDRGEILEVMNMSSEDMDDSYSVLSNIMKRKYPFNGNTVRSVTVQTTPEEIGYSLEQRLALIDQEHRKNIAEGDKRETNGQKRKL